MDRDLSYLSGYRWLLTQIEGKAIELYVNDPGAAEEIKNTLSQCLDALTSQPVKEIGCDSDTCPPGWVCCSDGWCRPKCSQIN